MNDVAFSSNALRHLPSNVQAEQSLLGAILANNRAYVAVADFLEDIHFFDPVNAAIYRRAAERILDGNVADVITLKSDFDERGVLDDVGGSPYLASLITAMVGISNAGDYGRAIYDAWMRRKLIELGSDLVENAYTGDPRTDGFGLIDRAERSLSVLTSRGGRESRTLTIGQAVSAAIAQSERIRTGQAAPGLMTGMAAIDEALGGLWPEDLILMAGLPGAGKTGLAVQMAYAIAMNEYARAVAGGMTPEQAHRVPGVAVYSLEMTAEALGLRIAAWRAGVSMEAIKHGRVEDWVSATNLAQAEREAALLPLRIIDCMGLSPSLLAAKVRMQLRRQPELLVVIDHLLELRSDDPRAPDGGMTASSVTAAAQSLKRTARALHLPILVLTHLSRDHAKNDRRPVMSDLKLGGEGAADVVMFVHRPEMLKDAAPPKRGAKEALGRYKERCDEHDNDMASLKGLAEIVVPKNRQGATGIKRMRFRGDTVSFSEWGNG